MSDPSGEPSPPNEETAARYVARCLIADHGYVSGVPAEAAELADAVDFVLTGGDGVGLTLACFLDRDADPTRRFTLAPERLDEIAAACRVHAGSLHGMKDTVTVEIWEVGAGVPDPEDRARLEGYAFRRITQKGVAVKAYAVDTRPEAAGALYSTAADAAERAPWLRQVLTEPRRSRAELAAVARQHEKVARFHTKPIGTLGLLAAFAAMFVVSLVWSVVPTDGFLSPSVGTLISLGGLEHERTEGGEWWRMLTCAFLHGDLMHLLFNGVAMYMAGGVLEHLVGRRWMLGLFVIGAIGGSVASLAINPANVTSVGASGAIMALLAAAMVISLRLPKGAARTQILVSLGQILVPSLLPLAAHGGGKVDFGAHLGGAVTGAVAGGLVLLIWARNAERPRGAWLAAAVAGLGLAATGYGLIRVAADHDDYRKFFAGAALVANNPELLKDLVPNEELPGAGEELPATVARLQPKYPRDPRVQFWAGAIAFDAGDLTEARRLFEGALAAADLRALLADDTELLVRTRYLLGMTHEREDNLPLAQSAVLPSCDVGKRHEDDDIRAYYQRMCIAP